MSVIVVVFRSELGCDIPNRPIFYIRYIGSLCVFTFLLTLPIMHNALGENLIDTLWHENNANLLSKAQNLHDGSKTKIKPSEVLDL